MAVAFAGMKTATRIWAFRKLLSLFERPATVFTAHGVLTSELADAQSAFLRFPLSEPDSERPALRLAMLVHCKEHFFELLAHAIRCNVMRVGFPGAKSDPSRVASAGASGGTSA